MEIKIIQNAYVVDDLDKAMADFSHALGVGPFVGGGDIILDNHLYRGQPSDPIQFRVAFAQSGDLMIELVERISTGPDAFCDMFAPGACGLHHAATFCEDYVATRDHLVKLGYPVASEMTTPWGATICYVDTTSRLGHMLELYPHDAGLFELYEKVRGARDGWDGQSLVVPWL